MPNHKAKILGITTLALALGLASCQAPTTSTATPSGSGGSGGGSSTSPTTNDSTDFALTVSNSNGNFYTHDATSFTRACKISLTDATKDIVCLTEAEELDLHYGDTSLTFNVPASMCDYVTQELPYYYDLRPGYGPTAYTVDTSAGGAPVVTVTNAGAAGVNGGFAGKPYCNYDYTEIGGPNCCMGVYVLTEIAPPATAGGPNQVTVSRIEWGGHANNCVQGPARNLMPLDRDGTPLGVIYFTERGTLNRSYTMRAPGVRRGSNVYVGNYFDPADHGANVPMAFRAIDYTATGGGIIPATNPYHQFTCYDRDREILARIRLMVRDWNTPDEFALGAAGNPDEVGNETGVGAGTPNNDYNDWEDFGNTTASYPGEML